MKGSIPERMLSNSEIKKIEVGKICVCKDQINYSALCFFSSLWVLGRTCGKHLMLWKSLFFFSLYVGKVNSDVMSDTDTCFALRVFWTLKYLAAVP